MVSGVMINYARMREGINLKTAHECRQGRAHKIRQQESGDEAHQVLHESFHQRISLAPRMAFTLHTHAVSPPGRFI